MGSPPSATVLPSKKSKTLEKKIRPSHKAKLLKGKLEEEKRRGREENIYQTQTNGRRKNPKGEGGERKREVFEGEGAIIHSCIDD